MNTTTSTLPLAELAQQSEGELHYDSLMRTLYATDASAYQELPLAVALPKTEADIKALITFARKHRTSIIPRTAGTSLAGQCVGDGIVVDVSKYFTKIIDFNAEEGWVRVQPGVVRDQLNAFLKPHGYFFSPITSTANRAMIGGMVGNNSSGTTSIEYGTTREHVLELKTILSDGSEAVFKSIDTHTFHEKRRQQNLEGQIYQHIFNELNQPTIRKNIIDNFPKPSIHRRNTGYAVDYLLNTDPFSAENDTFKIQTIGGNEQEKTAFNFCKLLCGSEGTLAFTTEIKLHVDPLPSPHSVVVAAHFDTINDCMKATQFAMQHRPSACELMDKIILDCTKDNIEQRKNRFFIEGDPEGVLMIELRGQTADEAEQKAEAVIADLKNKGLGFAYPKVYPPNIKKVWALRSAGLGLLSNIPGDKKATTCIEDTAVALEDLADYISDFAEMLAGFGQRSVYYAHAGAGEIHLRPVLNLKTEEGNQQFREISLASAKLVKKYRGSLSGEHGDGRLRGEFIPMMVGEENYGLFQRIKSTWDEHHIFNPNKIVQSPPMNTVMRFSPEKSTPTFDTLLDFSETGGILQLAEKCNGSGDCRKLPLSGGTMCPSYMATRNEKETTRARANTLRTFLTKSTQSNPFDHEEIKEVMDLCLSCKGCTSECPSNVDMSSLKAEFLHQYYKSHGVPLRAKAFANINQLNKLGAIFPTISNKMLSDALPTGKLLKKILGVAPKRSLPKIQPVSLRKWYRQNQSVLAKRDTPKGEVYLFCDEFTNYNDTSIGVTAIELLTRLGYKVKMVNHPESGRAALSKGLLPMAQKVAKENVAIFSPIISDKTPLLGIEPSAILSFRDEYPRLVDKGDKEKAKQLAENVLLVDEFISKEIQKGNITAHAFTTSKKKVLLHGHCHQKALSSVDHSAWLLGLPQNYSVEVIPSGCCGMAGSFGYEKEHYDVSMQIGELVLFPAVRKANKETVIAALGTSCRHQILDGTGRKGLHPIEVLHAALV
ncbi:MAG: FAD-linked oxidase C-terminal domain-containing protein [Bacteroidota bacterium]